VTADRCRRLAGYDQSETIVFSRVQLQTNRRRSLVAAVGERGRHNQMRQTNPDSRSPRSVTYTSGGRRPVWGGMSIGPRRRLPSPGYITGVRFEVNETKVILIPQRCLLSYD